MIRISDIRTHLKAQGRWLCFDVVNARSRVARLFRPDIACAGQCLAEQRAVQIVDGDVALCTIGAHQVQQAQATMSECVGPYTQAGREDHQAALLLALSVDDMQCM